MAPGSGDGDFDFQHRALGFFLLDFFLFDLFLLEFFLLDLNFFLFDLSFFLFDFTFFLDFFPLDFQPRSSCWIILLDFGQCDLVDLSQDPEGCLPGLQDRYGYRGWPGWRGTGDPLALG